MRYKVCISIYAHAKSLTDLKRKVRAENVHILIIQSNPSQVFRLEASENPQNGNEGSIDLSDSYANHLMERNESKLYDTNCTYHIPSSV